MDNLETIFSQAFESLKSQIRNDLRQEIIAEIRSGQFVMETDRDLDVREAAKELSMSESSLRKLCRQKRIPHRTIGSLGSKNPRYLFSLWTIRNWKREQEKLNYHAHKQQVQQV